MPVKNLFKTFIELARRSFVRLFKGCEIITYITLGGWKCRANRIFEIGRNIRTFCKLCYGSVERIRNVFTGVPAYFHSWPFARNSYSSAGNLDCNVGFARFARHAVFCAMELSISGPFVHRHDAINYHWFHAVLLAREDLIE